MFDFDDFTQTSQTQFTISYELLALLQWITEHNEEMLREVITSAIDSGLQRKLHKQSSGQELPLVQDMQHNIMDFLSLLEGLLYEAMNEQMHKRAREQDLIPALDHIDSSQCDEMTVKSSLEKVTSTLAENPDSNPKELLFKELLRRWQPHNKDIAN